jgi:hypothetical protein
MSKKSLIYILSIFLLIGITFTTQNTKAHRPIHLNLSYDQTDDIFTISFIHGVTDPNYHYVASVTINVTDHITLNSTVSIYYYTSQPTTNIFTYEYPGIIANDYDRIDITAVCSLSGTTVKTIEELGIPRVEHKDTFASTIVPSLVSALLVLTIIMLPRLSKKRRNKI